MADKLCEIIIKIKDFYPKLKVIPYNDYDCIISFNEDKLIIPLKNIEKIFFKKEMKKINSDLIYNITLVSHENKSLICNSNLLIPYIRLKQVVKMKSIKYEQQVKLKLEDDIKRNFFGPGITVGSIFLKFIIKINAVKNLNSNNILENNTINIKGHSKNKNTENSSVFSMTTSISNFSTLKNMDNNEKSENEKKYKKTKYLKEKSVRKINNYFSNDKIQSKKNRTIFIPTSPPTLKHHIRQPFEQLSTDKKMFKKYYISPTNNFHKIYKSINNNNINLKRNFLRPLLKSKVSFKDDKENYTQTPLPNCFSETSFREKKVKIPPTHKRFKDKVFSQENKKDFLTIFNNTNYFLEKSSRNENTEIKTDKMKKKSLKKVKIKQFILNSKKKNTINNNDVDTSFQTVKNKEIIKSKTSKRIERSMRITKKNTGKISKNIKNNEKPKNKFKDLNLIEQVKNQEDLKNNIISMINYIEKKNKESKQNYIKKINSLDDKYLLYKEKIVFENKKSYSLKSQYNEKDFKNFVHVKINSKFNNKIFNKMSKIKKKELNIIKIILNNKNEQNKDPKKIIQEKLKQQKKVHLLLNVIRDLIKNYGNLSHIYDNDNDNNKKILIKSLFLRYNIREKEWNNNDNLVNMYKKMINEIESNKNIEKLKNQEFKAIKEEEENDEEEEEDGEIKEKNKEKENDEKKVKEEDEKEINIISKIKENDNNENLNINNSNNNATNSFDINEIKVKTNNNIISLDENINSDNISNGLINKNIIINNFIINNK